LRLFSFGGYGLALAALALVVFGAIECPPLKTKYTQLLFYCVIYRAIISVKIGQINGKRQENGKFCTNLSKEMSTAAHC